MGWIDKLLKRKPRGTTYAKMLNGHTPIFSQFGSNIYASDVVQQALGCIVHEMKKLNPMHVCGEDGDATPIKSSIQAALRNPNEFMTTSDFLEKIVWQLFFNYNCFVIPTYYVWKDAKDGQEKRHYTGFYPVAPTYVELIKDAADVLYVHMQFRNDYETTLRYRDVIHIRYNYSVNEFMGGNEVGQPDHKALLKTLELNNITLQGIASAMKANFAVNAVVKYNTMMDEGKTEEALKELEAKLKRSESGFLPLDLRNEFIPISKDIKLVDEATLKFIDEKILRNFGVPLCILTGDYTKAQYEAFYQKTLEPLIVSISQAFTKALFTDRALAYGNRIALYPKDLIFMSIDQTIEMVRLLGDAGALYENEKRVAFGLRPLPELVGKRMQSLNYVDVDLAPKYQLNEQKEKGENDGTNE